jgi:hypothetical protein
MTWFNFKNKGKSFILLAAIEFISSFLFPVAAKLSFVKLGGNFLVDGYNSIDIFIITDLLT